SVLSVIIDCVAFHTTHEGLYGLLKAVRRKREASRVRHLRTENQRIFLSKIPFKTIQFFSITVSNVRVGLWPSTQLADRSLLCHFGDHASHSAIGRARNHRHQDVRRSSVRPEKRASVDGGSERLNVDYFSWATNSCIAATFGLSYLLVTFQSESGLYVSRSFYICGLHIRVKSGPLCGKLLSTSDTPDTEESYEEDGDSYKSGKSAHQIGMLLGHLGAQAHLNVVLLRRTLTEPAPFGQYDVSPSDWLVNSVCVKFFGFRAGLMEGLFSGLISDIIRPAKVELETTYFCSVCYISSTRGFGHFLTLLKGFCCIEEWNSYGLYMISIIQVRQLLEILKQSLWINSYVSSLPSSPLGLASVRRTSITITHSPVQRTPSIPWTEIGHSTTEPSISTDAHPFPAHMCVAFLSASDYNQPFASEVPSTKRTDGVGFHFELIRFMFR
ncbi:hypothetical protein X801_06573, partial [Opisthorchis viverrini]